VQRIAQWRIERQKSVSERRFAAPETKKGSAFSPPFFMCANDDLRRAKRKRAAFSFAALFQTIAKFAERMVSEC
jgi:hypothetical protein